MKTKVLMWMVASAIVLTFSHPASADVGRTVTAPFEFYAVVVSAAPATGEDHVALNVVDSQGTPVYFTVRQDGNPEFGYGCGTVTSHPGGLFPIHDRSDVHVFPWAGPSVDDGLEPGGDICPGSMDPNLLLPGVVGTVTFTFHNHSLIRILGAPMEISSSSMLLGRQT